MEKSENIKNIHFIGIGGISMSSLAAIAKKRGYIVSGSDRTPSSLTERLENMGISIHYPQAAENIENPDLVVYTAAIAEDNPELAVARDRGIRCITRSAYLGELMKEYPVRIGVSGTHGKSSTTGLLSQIFMAADMDPTVTCGAEIPEFDSAYRLGGGEHFIYEACEYKDSFLDFYPSVAVILNIEMDHVDYYHSMEQMRESYKKSAKDAGAVVVNWDDPEVRAVAEKLEGVWVIRAGVENPLADYNAVNVTLCRGFASFDLMKENEKLCTVRLRIPGLHHVHNAVCAAAAAHICGIDPEQISRGISDFKGIRRRFEYKGNYNGVEIYDDYAHHPTEVEATLKTAREMTGETGRLFCVFQPHTYSRTAGLFDDFVKALSGTDRLILAPIYAAREKNIYGISSKDLAKHIPGAVTVESFEEAAALLADALKEGDLLLTMGAGNAFKVGDLLLK